MKKLLTILFILTSFIMSANAEETQLPSETAIVTEVNYQDTEALNQENVKQEVTIKILTGKFKGSQRIIDNMLTGNPAYDIPLSKGDKVIVHVEPVSEIIATDKDVDFFIAVGLIFYVLMPLTLNGFCPIASAILVGILSTIITIYLVGGFNSKSTSAVVGTSISLVFAGLLSILAIYFAHLTGFAGEENMFRCKRTFQIWNECRTRHNRHYVKHVNSCLSWQFITACSFIK